MRMIGGSKHQKIMEELRGYKFTTDSAIEDDDYRSDKLQDNAYNFLSGAVYAFEQITGGFLDSLGDYTDVTALDFGDTYEMSKLLLSWLRDDAGYFFSCLLTCLIDGGDIPEEEVDIAYVMTDKEEHEHDDSSETVQ